MLIHVLLGFLVESIQYPAPRERGKSLKRLPNPHQSTNHEPYTTATIPVFFVPPLVFLLLPLSFSFFNWPLEEKKRERRKKQRKNWKNKKKILKSGGMERSSSPKSVFLYPHIRTNKPFVLFPLPNILFCSPYLLSLWEKKTQVLVGPFVQIKKNIPQNKTKKVWKWVETHPHIFFVFFCDAKSYDTAAIDLQMCKIMFTHRVCIQSSSFLPR